jgi:hypothetical protein
MKQNILNCMAGFVHKLKRKIKCVTQSQLTVTNTFLHFYYKIELQKVYLTLIMAAC